MVRECLKYMPICDLVKMAMTCKAMRSMAMAEVFPLVENSLRLVVGDVTAFLQILKVCAANIVAWVARHYQ